MSYIVVDSDDSEYMDDESEEESDQDMHAEGCESVKTGAATQSYRVISRQTLANLQGDAIDRATSTLACSESEASIVLRHFRWNFDLLMEAVVDKDRDTVFATAGAITSVTAEPAEPTPRSMCMICMEDMTSVESMTMSCGHTFCKICWTSHFQILVEEGCACSIQCMAHKCQVLCNQTAVKELLRPTNPAALKKYEHALVNSYIEDNGSVKWCPSIPCCGHAVEALDDGYCEPVCECGQSFCFKCAGPAHSPATCKMWHDWEDKMSGDSETVNYLKAHVKPCPKCDVPVEKNGGCNLVVCRSCRQPFCWLCGAKTGTSHTWERIDGHTCGEWKVASDKEIEEGKARHERYMHYYSHYNGHLQSMKKEAAAAAELDTLVTKLREHVSDSVDWMYLHHARCVLLECRRVLSNAYVFSFCMFDASKFTQDMTTSENQRLQLLFEDGMSRLTSTVESLSKDLEEEILGLQQSLNVSETAASMGHQQPSQSQSGSTNCFATNEQSQQRRQKIMNLTVNIDKRIRNLFELIEKDVLASVCSQNMQISPYTPVHTPPALRLS